MEEVTHDAKDDDCDAVDWLFSIVQAELGDRCGAKRCAKSPIGSMYDH
jgi:hypothetical protein